MKINDRYSLIESKFSGGMGEVASCFDEHLGREVVIKKLHSSEESRRIVDEQKALLRLRSKHVVQLFDVVMIKEGSVDVAGLVLESINGRELSPESYSPDLEYLHVLWQVCCGLSDIHLSGMVHRDVKPNNILLDEEGIVKIIDFGLSRSLDCAETRSIIGTPFFMAPELWCEGTVNFDTKVDVYAFGVTALILLNKEFLSSMSACPPFAISEDQVRKVSSGVPKDVADMLVGCLRENPRSRPDIIECKEVLEKNLLRDRHRALVVINGASHQLDRNNRTISLNAKGGGRISIHYDGFDFSVASALGSVFLNNVLASPGQLVPGCCVITFGSNGGARTFVTFDVSNPEVLP